MKLSQSLISFVLISISVLFSVLGRVSASSSYIQVPTECGNDAHPWNMCAPFEKHVLANDAFCRPGRACYCCEGKCLQESELTRGFRAIGLSSGLCPSGDPPGAYIIEQEDDQFDDPLDDEEQIDEDAPFALAVHPGDSFEIGNGFEMLILEEADRRLEMKKQPRSKLRKFERKLRSRSLKIRVTRKGVSKSCSGRVSGIKGCRRLGGKCCHSISSGTVKCREGSRKTCRKIFGRKRRSSSSR